MSLPFQQDLSAARAYAERGLAGFDTLDLGPLDYNVFTTADNLRTAAAMLERWGQEAAALAKATGGEDGR